METRLRERAPAARGSQDVESHNLDFQVFHIFTEYCMSEYLVITVLPYRDKNSKKNPASAHKFGVNRGASGCEIGFRQTVHIMCALVSMYVGHTLEVLWG